VVKLRHSLDLLVDMMTLNVLVQRDINPYFLHRVNILVELMSGLINMSKPTLTK
jgi:hypothetical protein